MNNIDKRYFERLVSESSAEDLINMIKSGKYTFEQMRATGKLHHSKQAAIRNYLAQIEEEEENIRRENFQQEQERLEREKYLNNLNNYSSDEVRNLIQQNMISRQEVISRGIFSEKALDFILRGGNNMDDTDFADWGSLPPLQSGRTDVYVFGVAGSGKSSMLAGLLRYASDNGVLGIEVSKHEAGANYRDELINRTKKGIVPTRTSAEALNYILAPIKDASREKHPLSIIEMSGELFTRTYKQGLNGENTIGARGYLKNENRKILFFVVDYQFHKNELHDTGPGQFSQLERVLGYLHEDGTLRKTDAIFVVVTKADLMPNGYADHTEMHRFLNQNYGNLIANIQDFRKDFGYKYRSAMHPFSLGRFEFDDFYTYNSDCSEAIFKDLIKTSFKKKKKGLLSRWFR